MNRIYLSGPMTGLPELNFPAFAAMTTSLRSGGHTVTNATELNPDGGTWNDCMRRDIAALMDCGESDQQFRRYRTLYLIPQTVDGSTTLNVVISLSTTSIFPPPVETRIKFFSPSTL